jgi:hypothetical protein
MRIGIFGDSYCDKNVNFIQPSWFELLKYYGHEIVSFGEGGSSILFSAMLLDKHANEFDFLIWGVTNPPRLSITINEPPYTLHFTQGNTYIPSEFKKHETVSKVVAVSEYFNHLLEFNEQDLIGLALVNHTMSKHKNLMVIPCFSDPLRLDFNLFDLCSKEIDYYFPNISYEEFFQTYSDLRRCHLSLENNKILADIVANNLKPGVFQTNYDNFVMNPNADKTFYFKKN